MGSRLDENYRIRAEAFLAESIIEARGGLREPEVYSLGLALYQRGSADPTPDYQIETDVWKILGLLLVERRIRFDGERYVVNNAAEPERSVS